MHKILLFSIVVLMHVGTECAASQSGNGFTSISENLAANPFEGFQRRLADDEVSFGLKIRVFCDPRALLSQSNENHYPNETTDLTLTFILHFFRNRV